MLLIYGAKIAELKQDVDSMRACNFYRVKGSIISNIQEREYSVNNIQQPMSKVIKPQRGFLYIVILSLVYAAVMLILSNIFADTGHSQSLIMPIIAMLFAPLFLLY
jgi:hypothetical protein